MKYSLIRDVISIILILLLLLGMIYEELLPFKLLFYILKAIGLVILFIITVIFIEIFGYIET